MTRLPVSVLTQAFPQSLVDEVLAETGRVQQRNRLLPARLVVYFVLAMCLFSRQSYEEVARLLTAGLQGTRRWRRSRVVPSTAAIWKARSRLGVEPLRLFARVCRPVATPDTQGAYYRDWRLTAIDGTTFDLPDTKANVEAFGRPPRSGRGEQDVGYPQLHGFPLPHRTAPSHRLTGKPLPPTTRNTLENPATTLGLRHDQAAKTLRPPDS
ncbi:transposase domain-containing protein [Streptomyces mirabilis]